MSGHSKWATIKRKKGKIDDERGKIFTKISKEIAVAVKQGGPDADGNFRLKLAIQKAKSNNMPADNINRCIQKAAGNTENTAYEEFFYEGYGPGGVAVLAAIMTDNRNRTASEIRYIFSRNNGNLGETGCVSWMFERKGQIVAELKGKDEDDLMLLALEAGAEDIEIEEELASIFTDTESLEPVRAALLVAGYTVSGAEIVMKPANTVAIGDVDMARKLIKLLDALEDNDDVQQVYANYDIDEDILAKLED
ncbi:MAG: YebC/PmpR family DNA-binding transcriptional regulator [Firmicutes bacterium]|nr:YebC/PmpR family DNA-binding transcriptional regulator [Bacillota bacterium]